jgi:hypothetical protein
MDLIDHLLRTAWATLADVAPIAVILIGFQFLALRKRPANLRRIAGGFVYVLIGLTLFLVGLEQALFPLGESMAKQLTAPDFIGAAPGAAPAWRDYLWVYVFAAAIGFATTIAEPALIAVSMKAQTISGGTLSAVGLRIAVAVGVALGVALGAHRIVTGTPMPYYILAGYVIVVLQTLRAAKTIIPLAYDSGGVTTSTVTVPVVTALGLGLASTIPGRNPLIDGFGLIAFASLFPIMSVLAYAILTARLRGGKGGGKQETPQ